MKKLLFVFIIALLSLSCVVCANQPWCGTQQLYFQHNSSISPAGYEELINFPSGNPEIIENVSVIGTGGPVLIDNYISPIGSMNGVTTLDAGLRRYRIYAYVSGASGVTQLNFTKFVRHADGSETNIYTALSGDIDALSVAERDFSFVMTSDLSLNSTDRLGIRVSANTTHSAPIFVYWVYQGATHTSMLDSGFFVCPGAPTNYNESYAYSPSKATPLTEWIVVALTALVLFICAFYLRLRNEDGEISKERIVFSIVSSVVCGLAAYLSLEIIIPSNGLATSVVYQLPVIAILFTILSVLAFANFIYCIMQKDMVQPDKKDYNNKMEEERK